MSIVVDSSVLVAALVDVGPHGIWAESVLVRGSLYAPELARAEATNILRRLERAKMITTPEANGAQNDLMQLDIDVEVLNKDGRPVHASRLFHSGVHPTKRVTVEGGFSLPCITGRRGPAIK